MVSCVLEMASSITSSMVERITASERCPHPNPENLCLCYSMQKAVWIADGIKEADQLTLRWDIVLGYLGKLSTITKAL